MENLQIKQTSQMAFFSAFVKYTATSPDGTPLRSLQNRMTCVLEPKDGRWKITHEHTSAPVDHNTLKVSLKALERLKEMPDKTLIIHILVTLGDR